jgi:hypothetical protein
MLPSPVWTSRSVSFGTLSATVTDRWPVLNPKWLFGSFTSRSTRSPVWLSVIVTSPGAMRQPSVVTRAPTSDPAPVSMRTWPSSVFTWSSGFPLTGY